MNLHARVRGSITGIMQGPAAADVTMALVIVLMEIEAMV